MTADYPTDSAPATPEYVFDMLHAPALSGVRHDLTYERAADEPADRYFGPDATDLLFALSDRFWLHVPDELLDAFGPLEYHTVREVCERLAAHITRPVVRAWMHVAGDCLPAGAFLSVRAMLVDRGADPARITPSTPLARYLRWYGPSLLTWLARVAPGRVPPVAEPSPWRGFLCLLFAPLPVFFLLGLAELGAKAPVWVFQVAIFGGAPFTLLGLYLMARELWVPRLGELQTFRDLAYCLAGQQPRRMPPTPENR